MESTSFETDIYLYNVEIHGCLDIPIADDCFEKLNFLLLIREKEIEMLIELIFPTLQQRQTI